MVEEAKAFEQSLAVLPESVVTVNVSRLRISGPRLRPSRAMKNLPDSPRFQNSWISNPTRNPRASLSCSSPQDGLRVILPAAAEVMYSFHVRRKRNILFQQNALIPHKAGRGPWPSQGPKRRWNQSHRLSEMVIYEVCVHLYLRLLKACYCLSKSRDLMGRRDGSHLSGWKVPSGLAGLFIEGVFSFTNPLLWHAVFQVSVS